MTDLSFMNVCHAQSAQKELEVGMQTMLIVLNMSLSIFFKIQETWVLTETLATELETVNCEQ
jgi:hypothetical protein